MPGASQTIRIGGASGFWGDAALASEQLLRDGGLDFIVYDYLAEITMAILARMRAADPDAGFAGDFLTGAMRPNLAEIARQRVRIIANAGGMNPEACATELRKMIADQGLQLKVSTVTGDDLLPRAAELAGAGHSDMFTNAAFPNPASIASINAYLGAFPIAMALDQGADIVLTGRCVDSAVTLGAAIHAFGWQADDYDLLAAGSMAGHILECGTQATGGNFTDWHLIKGGFETIGYPIAELAADGKLTITKPKDTGGLVSTGTVCEQLVYEIADPQAYLLPDVTCDFSGVTIRQTAPDRVALSGVKGRAPTLCYKTCLTWQDGWRGGHLFGYYGIDADQKAEAFASAALGRASAALLRRKMTDFTETSVEILGAESQFGANRRPGPWREVNAKIAVRHASAAGVGLFLKEATGLGLSAPPGLSGFAGARPKPSPVMALFSFLLPKDQLSITITGETGSQTCRAAIPALPASPPPRPAEPAKPAIETKTRWLPVIDLALARSGDKGDSANIGVIARHPDYLPHLWHLLNEAEIGRIFGHFLKGGVERYLLPGCHAFNIVLNGVLGGGGTSSLRNDPQAKGYAQLLLAHQIEVPNSLLEV